MRILSDTRMEALKQVCSHIAMTHPDAIGMAMIELDCGCIEVCGVSVTGAPVGKLRTISGRRLERQGAVPVCLKCYRGGGRFMERIVNQGIIWPGTESEKPDAALREFIGEQVFGPGYHEFTE